MSILGKSYSSDCLLSFDAQLSVLAATQAFKRQRQTILDESETAFKLTSYLLSKDIVPDATKTRVIFSGLSRAEMTVAFMDAIEARIMVNPSVFDNIIELLKAHPNMNKFAEELLQFQSELCFNLHDIICKTRRPSHMSQQGETSINVHFVYCTSLEAASYMNQCRWNHERNN